MTVAVEARPKLLKSRMRHTRWFMFLMLPVLLFTIGYYQQHAWQDQLMEWTGFFLVCICVLGRSYCSMFIGGLKNEQVVRQGPFSIVRNPLYVFSFIGVIGIGLQSGRFSIMLFLVLVFMVYYRFVVAREEAFLTDRFGDAYRKYVNEVPRWFPKLSLWSEPAEVVVRPVFIRNTMRDGLLFFLAWPILETLETMQNMHLIPTITLF